MDAIRKALAALCVILFVFTALAALLLFNLERRAFNASTYKQALADRNIYEQVPALVGEMMVASANYDPCAVNPIACQAEARSPEAVACFEAALGAENYDVLIRGVRTPSESELRQAERCLSQYPPVPSEDEGGPPPFVANLTAEDWRQLITALMPPSELKSLTDQAIDSIFAFFNGRAESAYLDMTGFKRRLTGPAGAQAVLTLLRAQPPCTLEQIAAMTISVLSLQGDLELCSPSDELARVIQPLIEFNLQLAVLGIPDQVTLIPHTINLSGDATPLEALRIARLIMRLSPLIPLVLLLAITLLAVRTLLTWLKWWGWPLLITGIVGALIGFLGAPVVSLVLTNLLTRRLPAYLPVGIVELSSQVTGAVARQMLRPVAWEGLALTVIAGGMLYMANRRERKEARLAASEASTRIS